MNHRKLFGTLMLLGAMGISYEAQAVQYIYMTGAVYGNYTGAAVAYPQVYASSTQGVIYSGGYVQLYDYANQKQLYGSAPNEMKAVNNISGYAKGLGYYMTDRSNFQLVNYTIRVQKGR